MSGTGKPKSLEPISCVRTSPPTRPVRHGFSRTFRHYTDALVFVLLDPTANRILSGASRLFVATFINSTCLVGFCGRVGPESQPVVTRGTGLLLQLLVPLPCLRDRDTPPGRDLGSEALGPEMYGWGHLECASRVWNSASRTGLGGQDVNCCSMWPRVKSPDYMVVERSSIPLPGFSWSWFRAP